MRRETKSTGHRLPRLLFCCFRDVRNRFFKRSSRWGGSQRRSREEAVLSNARGYVNGQNCDGLCGGSGNNIDWNSLDEQSGFCQAVGLAFKGSVPSVNVVQPEENPNWSYPILEPQNGCKLNGGNQRGTTFGSNGHAAYGDVVLCKCSQPRPGEWADGFCA